VRKVNFNFNNCTTVAKKVEIVYFFTELLLCVGILFVFGRDM
jgi:hypothetical protein